MPVEPIYRAPMRARDRDLPPGEGAAFGIEHGLVGTGDLQPTAPDGAEAAVAAAAREHGAKAGRMLERFIALPAGTLVWTSEAPGVYRLGRITGPWRYDDSPAAHAVGIHHVRPARWLPPTIGDAEVPSGVAATFARGGRNLQRIHDAAAERATARLWDELS